VLSLDELVLVPRPRVLLPTGLGPLVDECGVRSAVDPTLPAEGFRLDITADRGAVIAHRDDAGLRYGLALLDQLLAQPIGGHVLGVHIEDHPDLPVRTFMLDVSRDRVPTRATLERFVELLALARYNRFQLYIEHTFAHEGHEVVWRDASPLTADDLRWLDDRCHAVGIELVVNRNAFGHFERWLRHRDYAHRAEAPAGAELAPGIRLPASVLAPTEENAAFALDLVREQLACVRSRRVNIGCDETFELGQGASAARCAAEGKGRVYLDHVLRIARPLVDDGYEVEIWADVLRRHPELASELPEGVVPVAWTYEPPTGADLHPDVPGWLAELLASVGIDTDASGGFATNVAPLVEAGIAIRLASGTADWNTFAGRWDTAVGNQIDAVETALATGADGVTVTAWGDHGHHHPPSVTFAPLVHGGAVAWCLDANRSIDLHAVLDRWVFADEAEALGGAVAELGGLWRRTGRRALNASPLAAAVLPQLPLLVTGDADPGEVAGVLDRIEAIADRLAAARPASADGPVVLTELSATVALVRNGAHRLLGPDGPGPASLADELDAAIARQRAAWLDRAQSGGLGDSLDRLHRTVAADRALADG
jgi:hypothetical protein